MNLEKFIASAVFGMLIFDPAFFLPNESATVALAEENKSAEYWLETGDELLYSNKDYTGAIKCYRNALALDPDEYTWIKIYMAYDGIAYDYRNEQRYQEAVDTLNELINISRDAVAQERRLSDDDISDYLSHAYENLGDTYAHVELYEDAARAYREAVEVYPYNFDAAAKLGDTCLELEKYIEALDAFGVTAESLDDALKNIDSTYLRLLDASTLRYVITSTHAHYFRGAGIAMLRLAYYDDAVEVLLKSIELAPHINIAYRYLGLAYVNLGEYEKAVEALRDHVEAYNELLAEYNEEETPWWNILGIAYENLERYQEAADAYSKAVEFASDNESYRENLDRVLAKLPMNE